MMDDIQQRHWLRSALSLSDAQWPFVLLKNSFSNDWEEISWSVQPSNIGYCALPQALVQIQRARI